MSQLLFKLLTFFVVSSPLAEYMYFKLPEARDNDGSSVSGKILLYCIKRLVQYKPSMMPRNWSRGNLQSTADDSTKTELTPIIDDKVKKRWPVFNQDWILG